MFSAMHVEHTIFNFWHSGTLVLRAERQSVRMSEINNGMFDLYAKAY